MFKYILKRLLYFVPTLFVISLFTFALSKTAPGDPVELRLAGGMQGGNNSGQKSDKLAGEEQYIAMKKKLGLDIPAFYFSVSSQAVPDTLYKITRKKERENLVALSKKYGNWEEIQNYYGALKAFENKTFEVERNATSYNGLKVLGNNYAKLVLENDDEKIDKIFQKFSDAISKKVTIEKFDTVVAQKNQSTVSVQNSNDSLFTVTTEEVQALASMQSSFDNLVAAYDNIKNTQTPIKNWIPQLNWYGFQNQYHVWLFGNTAFKEKNDPNLKYGFFRGDFGDSYLDGRPVKSIIWDALGITMKMNIIALLLAYFIAIPLGVRLARKRGTKFDRVTSIILFVLYSLPSFWIATIFIVFFTTNEFGMDWFPTYGIRSNDLAENASVFVRFFDQAHHLVLPILAMIYGAFTFAARQMRGSMLGVIKQDYIRTAKAKGLSDDKVIWKHTFRNSLIPIITMFAGILPSLIGGSFVIEVIFNINGMGRVAYTAVLARNYPVMFTVLMFSAILTMAGMLLADLLYSAVDPRISFTNKKG